MQFSRLQKSAASASALAVLCSFSGVAALEKYATQDKYEWDNSLSCAQCIRSDFVYVYENSATGIYFKEIPRGTPSTGFCCKQEAGASTYQCEKPPAGPDPRIAAMWSYYNSLTATSAKKGIIEQYMNRLFKFETDGKAIYKFYLDKLIDLHAARLKVEATAKAAGKTAAVDDGAGFLALLEQLKPRVVYAEFASVLGRPKAIEYLQYIEIIKTYIGVKGGTAGDSDIAAAGAGDAYITADLLTLTTAKTKDDKNFLTKDAAKVRLAAAKDMAVWYDVEKVIGNANMKEFKLHIAEVATKESIVASQVYIDYLYKAFDIQNTATYLPKLKEIRKRVANLRFQLCTDTATAIIFNKLWIEMESYENQVGDDTRAVGSKEKIIAKGYTDTYIKNFVTTTTQSTNTKSANASIYTTELARLKLEVLWYYVSWNTNVEIVKWMKTYFTRLDTYSGVTNTLTTYQTKFQAYKDDYKGTAQQDTRFITDFNTVKLNTFKKAIMYFMNTDTPKVTNADTYFLAFAQGNSRKGQLNMTDAQLLVLENSYFDNALSATNATYQTKYRKLFWDKLRESNTHYWTNTTGTTWGGTGQAGKVAKFWGLWAGVVDAWDVKINGTAVRKPEEKELQDIVVTGNKTNFDKWVTDSFYDLFWRQAHLVNFDPSADLTSFKDVVLAGLYPTANDYYKKWVTGAETKSSWDTKHTTAWYNEQRQTLRYQWATSKTLGLARVTGMSDADRTRYKEKIDQRYTDKATKNLAKSQVTVPAYNSANWNLRTVYIDALILKLENKAKGVDSSTDPLKLSAAWFLTNMQDPLDKDIFKTLYIPSSDANQTQDRTDFDAYYSEMGGTANAGVTVDAKVAERRALVKKFVDATFTATTTDTDMGELYYKTLINRANKAINADSSTAVWTTVQLKAQWKSILDEINTVTGTLPQKWDDGYNWYVKGRALLQDTDNADFTNAKFQTLIKTLREDLLLKYLKKLDTLTTTAGGESLDANYGRAASLFAMFDYMLVVETGANVATEAAYDRAQYIKALWDAKELDANENLNITTNNTAGEEIALLRTYEQIYGEMTQRIDRLYLDVLEKIVELNGASSAPAQAAVEQRMEAVNYLRYDLYGGTILKTSVWDKTSSMDTFDKYQNTIKTELMGPLLTQYTAAGDDTARVKAYSVFRRKVDSLFIACKLFELNISGAGTAGLGSMNFRATSNSKTNAYWFYQWSLILTNDTYTTDYTVIDAEETKIIAELLKNTPVTGTIVDSVSKIMYDYLKYRMKNKDSGKETTYTKALGGSWTKDTNNTFGYAIKENITKALADATADWTSVSAAGDYDASTNFLYIALTNACNLRGSSTMRNYNNGSDDPIFRDYGFYKTAVDQVKAKGGDGAWKAFLETCYNKNNARDFVFTTLDTFLQNTWAKVIDDNSQTQLTGLYAATEFHQVAACSSGGTKCVAQTKAVIVTTANKAAYVKGIWDKDDTAVYTVATTNNKARVGYLFSIGWGVIAKSNWKTSLNTDPGTKTPIPTTDDLLADKVAFTRGNIDDWISNCIPGTSNKAARWEYFYNNFLALTEEYATFTSQLAAEHMIKYCLVDTYTKLASGDSTYAHKYSSATFLAWYAARVKTVSDNTNWTNTKAAGSPPYYNQLFVDEGDGNATANLQDIMPSELAAQTKATTSILAASTQANIKTAVGPQLVSISKAVEKACEQWVAVNSITPVTNCTNLNNLATTKNTSDGIYYCHQYISDLMGAMSAANTSALFAQTNQTFRNLIYWADVKCGPGNKGLLATGLESRWSKMMTVHCAMASTVCTDTSAATLWGKLKSIGGSTSNDSAGQNVVGLQFLDSYDKVFALHNTAGSPPVSSANWTAVWTKIKDTKVFVTATAPNAMTKAMHTLNFNGAPGGVTNWPTAWLSSSTTSANNAGVQQVYDYTMLTSIDYEIDNETFTQGSSEAQSRKEAKAIILGMNSLTIQGSTLKEGTEFARTNMGLIEPAQFAKNEEWLYAQYWQKLLYQYQKKNSLTDTSAAISTDYTGNINTSGLKVTDYEGWYRTNQVGWTTGTSSTKATSSSYGCAVATFELCYETMRKNLVDFKVKGATLAIDSTLKTEFNAQYPKLKVLTDTTANTTNPDGTTTVNFGAKGRFDALTLAHWKMDDKTKADAAMQAFIDQMYYERFLITAGIDDFKEITALVDFIEHAETAAPLTTKYWTYYASQLNECYVNYDATNGGTQHKLPDGWEMNYGNVADCYQRWLGKVRFHQWNDLEVYITSREALGSNKPTFVAKTLWSYRTTLRTRLVNDYWAVTRVTGGKDSFDKFKVCTTASSPTCASVQSSLTATADGDSHPVVALTDGSLNTTFKIAGKKNSKDFTSGTFALAACPHLEKNCGKKNIHLKNSRSAPVEIGINMFDSASSCQWLLSAECALPAVNIFDKTKGIDGNLVLEFVEWQAGVVKLDKAGYPADVLTATPKVYKKPWLSAAGTLPDALNKDKGDKIPVELLLNTLASKRQQVEFYNNQLAFYNLALEEWDNAVLTAKARYQNQISKNKAAAAAGPAAEGGGIFDSILGAFGTSVAELEADPTERELSELPKKPTPPFQPSTYKGVGKEALKADLGYGTLTEGLFSLRSDFGTKKFFGVTGQGFGVDTELGYTLTPDLMKGCNRKYIALNVYPKKKTFTQGPDRLRFTVTAEEPADLNFNLPEKTLKPVQPQPAPSQTLINEFQQSWLDLDEALSGAAYLGASATAAALIAASLF